MGKASTFKDTKDTIDLFNDRFNRNIATRQKNMWSSIFQTITKLDTDSSGNILVNQKNLKTLTTLRGSVKKTIITPQYKKDLKRYLGAFPELKGINDTYYQTIASGTLNANKQVFNAITNISIDATKNSLLEAGITNEIIAPVEALLSQNVTTGGSLADLAESLRADILGTSDKLGKLERYTRQITTDSLNQFNANYNQTVSQDLGLQFYYYNGAIKETSRAYCEQRAGKFYHKKEVEDSANEQWAGKIPGTNSSTIFVYRGGFNCGHQWLAVDTLGVPKDIIERNISNGNYKP